MYFDDLLTDYVGECGRYQIAAFFVLLSLAIPFAFSAVGIVFIAAVPEHWCAVPVINNITRSIGLSIEQYRNITAPQGESCKMYNASYATWGESDITRYLSEGPPVTDVVDCMHGMAYSDEIYKSSITTEWDLVCSGEVMRATTSSLYMAGLMAGSLVTGSISDIIGRRPVLVVYLVFMVISSIAISFVPGVIIFCVMRFIQAFCTMGCYTAGFVTMMELMGVRWRMHMGVAVQYMWSTGYLGFALYAFFIREWRTLSLAAGGSCAILLLLIFIIPESPRWLYATKQTEKADTIVVKMAKWNKTQLPGKLEIKIKSERKGYIWDLFNTPRVRLRSLNCLYCWFVNSFVYYGLALNTSDLGGDDFVNYAIAGAVEIPAALFCHLTLTYLGRRWPLAVSMVVGGAVLLVIIPIPAYLSWVSVTLAMIGKFCITCSFITIWLYTAEMYPTVTRNVAVATGSLFARIGGLIAPYVVLLNSYGNWVPMVIFGSCSVLSGLLALGFPETKGKKLPETLEEGEAFGLRAQSSKRATSCVHPGSINGVDPGRWAKGHNILVHEENIPAFLSDTGGTRL